MFAGFIPFRWIDVLCVFFFFKQKTAYVMRISDWSSDVCSSDLLARRHVHVGGADLLQDGFGVAAFEDELGEGGLVEQADRVADRRVLLGPPAEPVGAAPGIVVARRHALRRVPVRPLPARDDAEAGAPVRAGIGKGAVDGAAPGAACRVRLADRKSVVEGKSVLLR